MKESEATVAALFELASQNWAGRLTLCCTPASLVISFAVLYEQCGRVLRGRYEEEVLL